jgi:hypothetical protein
VVAASRKKRRETAKTASDALFFVRRADHKSRISAANAMSIAVILLEKQRKQQKAVAGA